MNIILQFLFYTMTIKGHSVNTATYCVKSTGITVQFECSQWVDIAEDAYGGIDEPYFVTYRDVVMDEEYFLSLFEYNDVVVFNGEPLAF